MGKSSFLATSGRYFYMPITVMIQRIHGMVSSAALSSYLYVCKLHLNAKILLCTQAYKHVFTSPSSVDKEPKATRSRNARIHGMTRVTLPSVVYISTQVHVHHHRITFLIHWYWFQIRFSLMSSPVFSRTDMVTDSEQFYNSLLELFEDPDEKQEVDELLVWWNR